MLRSTRSLVRPAVLALLAGLAGPRALGGATPPRVIHSTLEGHPTAQVPGRPGLQFRNFWRPYASPSGVRWAMRANSAFFDSGSLLLLSENGVTSVVLAQNDPAPWAPGEVISTVDEQMGLNSAGQLAFSVNTNNGPDATDEYILRKTGSNIEVVVREGDPVPSLPGAAYGAILDETHILADGTVCFRNINATGVPTSENVFLARGGTILAREGVTVPVGQAGGGSLPWQGFDFYGYSTSPSGSKWIAIGDLAGTTADNIVTQNGAVTVQEGVQLFPFVAPPTTTPSGFCKGHVAPSGDVFLRGTNNDGQDWVRRNGDVIAATGQPVVPGAPEHYDDAIPNTLTFFLNTGNSVGDFVVGGYTDGPAGRSAVVTLNNVVIVLRRGAALDLDGNGAADDDLFLADFEADKAFLTPDRRLVMVVKVQNGAGTLDEQSKAIITVPLPIRFCPADINRDGQVNAADLAAVLGAWGSSGPADVDGDGVVGAADLATLLGSWGAC